MSAHNFWNNFTHGFMHGMFNNNPFFGCSWGNFGGNPFFNSCFTTPFFPSFTPSFTPFSLFTPSFTPPFTPPFTPFNSNLYCVPNIFSTMNFNQLMPNASPPLFDNISINMKELFPTDNWQVPSNNGWNFQVNTSTFDTFERTTSPKSSTSKPATMTGSSVNEKYFDKMLNHILSQEGGYVNDPADSGGETNKGVTKATYDGYRRKKGLPTRSVKEITDAEVREVYHEFFTGSGADKIDDPRMALMVFDTAVGSGCAKAKELFQKSGGDIKKYEQLRRDWYADIVRRKPKNQKFIKGWNNRVTSTVQFASTNLPSKVSA